MAIGVTELETMRDALIRACASGARAVEVDGRRMGARQGGACERFKHGQSGHEQNETRT